MQENQISSSIESSENELNIVPHHDYAVKGNERIISVLAQKIDELSKEIYELKKEKLLKETQLPEEVLSEHFQLKSSRVKNGRGYRPLMKHEILEAKNNSKNEMMAARYLRVSFVTYKKYAKMYDLWSPNQNCKSFRNEYDSESGKYPLSEILKGNHPDYPIFRLKEKLIRSGLKEYKCEMCGFKEKRITDGKAPLILNFMDGNSRNHSLENLKLFCYNCTFVGGRGYIRNGTKYFDPSWLQSASPANMTTKNRL